MPRFSHTPLASPRTEIRLLTLFLAGDSDDIVCTLRVSSLALQPVYTALSYEWGDDDPEALVPIKVNGCIFEVRHNLWLFLHRTKIAAQKKCSKCSPGQTSQLWIDAMCIDQRNVQERSAQVQMMGDIYRSANEVLVWLGWSENLHEKAISTLRQLKTNQEANLGEASTDFLLDGICCSDKRGTMTQTATFPEILDLVVGICRKTYWTRRWIVQEIVLGRKVLLVCGSQELPWSSLLQAFSLLRRDDTGLVPRKLLAEVSASTAVKIGRHQQDVLQGQNSRTVQELLRTYRSLQCDDFHDKIYAIVGLAIDKDVDLDYSVSATELFSRLFTLSMRREPKSLGYWRDLAIDCSLDISPVSETEEQWEVQKDFEGSRIIIPLTRDPILVTVIAWESFEAGVMELCPPAADIYLGERRGFPDTDQKAIKMLHEQLTEYAAVQANCSLSRSTLICTEIVQPIEATRDMKVPKTNLDSSVTSSVPSEDGCNKPSVHGNILFCHGGTRGFGITWVEVSSRDSFYQLYGNYDLRIVVRNASSDPEIVGVMWLIPNETKPSLLGRMSATLQALGQEAGLHQLEVWHKCIEHELNIRRAVAFGAREPEALGPTNLELDFDSADLIHLLQINDQICDGG